VQGDEHAHAETIAIVRCANCGREPQAGERWQVRRVDAGEVYAFCPECSEREFGLGRLTVCAAFALGAIKPATPLRKPKTLS
jgi:NMD protein affecting ribosome stability and mRNA decay